MSRIVAVSADGAPVKREQFLSLLPDLDVPAGDQVDKETFTLTRIAAVSADSAPVKRDQFSAPAS